jgi:hypothetical protein
MSKSKIAVSKKATGRDSTSYTPKTPRGRRLWALRARILAAGIPLLSPEDIEQEIAERRGEDD